jgi:hypothetical protein
VRRANHSLTSGAAPLAEARLVNAAETGFMNGEQPFLID